MFVSILSVIVCVLTDALLPLTPDVKTLWSWAVGTALVILAVRVLRWALKDRLSGRARYALWAVVLARALLPFQLPFMLPISLADVLPGPSEAIQVQSIPAPFSTSEPIRDAQQYYQGLEPGYLGPTTGSMGYVEISGDGETINYYVDLFSPAEVIRLVWIAGVMGMAGVLIVSNGRFYNKLKKTRRPLEIEDCPIPVYVAEGIPSPCLAGLFWPAIYLTAETAADEVHLRHVLTHELTHYAQRDHIWSALRCVCLCFHWFDPFMWWAAAQSKKDCELACDEGAVRRLGEEERIPYGRTLVDMVAAKNGPDLLSCATTMTGGKKTVQQRIEALVKHPETKRTALFLAANVLVILGVVVFAGRTEDLDPNADLTSPEDGYALLEELLDNDLPMFIYTRYPYENEGYITDPGLVDNAKTLLRTSLRPTDNKLMRMAYTDLDEDFLFSLNLFYESGENDFIRSKPFYLAMVENTHYIFLREQNTENIPMLTAVGIVGPRTAETMLDGLENQQEFDKNEWEKPQLGYYRYGKALDDLKAIGLHSRDSGVYTSLESERYQAALTQILPLLRQVSQVPAGMADFTAVSGNRITLYDSLGTFTAAGWNTRDYYLADGDDCYYLCIEHDEEGNGPIKYYTPVASMSKETWENILWLAQNPDGQLPEPEPAPDPEPEVPAQPEIRYYVNEPEQVEALIDLFLNDPETLETHGGEKLVDWLTNWTHGFTVVYGDPYWSFNMEQLTGWYAKAVDAGSFFPVTVRDGLVEDVLAICKTDPRTPYEFARNLKGADISAVTTSHPYTEIRTDHNALADLIRSSLDHFLARSFDQWEHGVWQVNVRTTDSSGQSYVGTGDNELILYAGQEENVVALYYGFAPEGEHYQFVRSEPLYEFVRSCFMPEQTIDTAAQRKLLEPINRVLLAELEERSLSADVYTGIWMTALEELASFDDLLADATVKLYYYDLALGVDDLRTAGWAGGAWADGEGRFRPYHNSLCAHLLTVEKDGNVIQSCTVAWEFPLREGETGPNNEETYVRDVVATQVRTLLTYTILIQEDDPQRAVENFGIKLAEQYRTLGSGHPRAVTDAKFVKAEIFDQSEDAVCATITLAVSPVEPNTIHWMAGAGIDLIDSGEYAGMWEYTLEYRLQKSPNGPWQCTESGTGGLRA